MSSVVRDGLRSTLAEKNEMAVNTTRPSYKWEVIFLLWIAYFLNQGDRQVFNTVLPHIQAFLGVSDSVMGMISTCFNLFFAATVPFAGYFADRMSRSKLIIFPHPRGDYAPAYPGDSHDFLPGFPPRCL